jgi:hypothetical protein
MAPNITSSPTGVLFEDDTVETVAVSSVEPKNHDSKPPQKYSRQIVWRNVILFVYLHLAAVYGAYLMLTSAKIITTVFGVYYFYIFLFIIIIYFFYYISCLEQMKSMLQHYCKLNDGNLYVKIFINTVIAKCLLQLSFCTKLVVLVSQLGHIDYGLIVLTKQNGP